MNKTNGRNLGCKGAGDSGQMLWKIRSSIDDNCCDLNIVHTKK